MDRGLAKMITSSLLHRIQLRTKAHQARECQLDMTYQLLYLFFEWFWSYFMYFKK